MKFDFVITKVVTDRGAVAKFPDAPRQQNSSLAAHSIADDGSVASNMPGGGTRLGDIPITGRGQPWADDEALRVDRRLHLRVVTTLRVGSLTRCDGEWPYLLSNLSAGGAMITCSAKLEFGEDVLLQLSNGRRVRGMVMWARQGRVGLKFHENASLVGLLAAATLAPGQQQRSPRFTTACPAKIAADGCVETANVLDISAGGLKIEMLSAVVGAAVSVKLPGLQVLQGLVVWAHGGRAGIAFRKCLSWDKLSRWYADHHIEIGRATSGFIGTLTAMIAAPATAAENAQQPSGQTRGSAEILDHVGLNIPSKINRSGASAEPGKLRSVDALVSISKSGPSSSGHPSGSGSSNAVIYQYN